MAATAATPESRLGTLTAEHSVHGAATPSFDGGRRAVLLRTERLLLAPVAESDLEELFALHANPLAFADDLTEPLTDREQMRWVLQQWIRAWQEHGTGYLTVRPTAVGSVRGRTADDGTAADTTTADTAARAAARTAPDNAAARALTTRDSLLGVVGLTPLTFEGGHVLSAYWRLDPAVTGCGIATEAARAVLADPRLGARDQKVIAVTAAGNRPSLALAARLGFLRSEQEAPGGRTGDVLLVRRPEDEAGT
ncbi:N-acetyltransferase [Brachybacterium alimentarium]|uniref:GNAT family N-acetyltransferase n=1 Tax=Brachybacterium alimentarium TaxID=47845 RepID=UPI000DF1EFC8|nr:GNAT family N-acetyltransferase [Brachybacterium alimentarium]RCS81630.1 N-acetyltransferase [Brachybacterium alimentarium]